MLEQLFYFNKNKFVVCILITKFTFIYLSQMVKSINLSYE
jgi:hypothetical protein